MEILHKAAAVNVGLLIANFSAGAPMAFPR